MGKKNDELEWLLPKEKIPQEKEYHYVGKKNDELEWLLLNEKEVGVILDCSVAKLRYDRARSIGCPYLKIGKLVRYRIADVKKFVENCVIQ